jgi:ABC-type oligopeptide transport system substrate-binding subunit/class 3 adenylate cyclase
MTPAEDVEGALPEERRVITALFADLVGSTALAEQLDPEEVQLIVADAVRRIVEAVEVYGGYVKDLAGDGVLAFFGAPVAHEDDAERAVLAGLRITSAIEAYGDEVAKAWNVERLAVRVGINTGAVVLGEIGGGQRVEYAAFGDAVNVAARLQAQAAPGSVLVAQPTRRMVEGRFAWGDELELELKGRGTPVRAAAVSGPHADATRAARRPGIHAPLVAREREIGQLRQAVENVAAGLGGIVLLLGEAGIGKSRLLQELRGDFTAARSPIGPGTWLEGRCVSYGESLPFWPFRDLLREWLGVAVDDPELRVRVALRRRVSELFGDRADEIYPYLGTLLGLSLETDAAGRVAELSPEALQYRTFEVVRTLFARLAQDGPVAVVLDDLHWADATSLQLASSLLATADEHAVLLVVAMRSERDRPSWQFRDEAASAYPHRLLELALEGIGDDGERQLLRALVGPDVLPPSIEERLLSHAEGNPFFLEELVRSITDAGALVREDDDRWRFDHEVELHVPETVEQVILARLARLAPDVRHVLTAASVLGRHFGLGLLEHLAEDGEIRRPLTELQRLDLVRESRRWPQPEYRFKHALIQESAYGTLVAARRRALHRRAAEWLERRREEGGEADLGLLAHHWLAADDEEQAIRYLTLAGDRARMAWSLDEAIDHYRALLPLLERRGERQAIAIVLFKLALALHTALRFREANDTYQRAFEHWTPPVAPAADAELRIGAFRTPSQPDPPRSYMLPDIRLQMALFDRLVERWPEATIVPSLAERWEISEDGLRYVFTLREGLRWSDGVALTAHDVQWGVRRNLDPERPAVSVGIYFVLEGAQDFYLRRHHDPHRIGVRALDDRTVEFRLAAPAPYFMSVVNRPDGGPQPCHAYERQGDAWLDPEHQVVSGAFVQRERRGGLVVLERRPDPNVERAGNVGLLHWEQMDDEALLRAYEAGEIDMAELLGAPDLSRGDITAEEVVLSAPASLYSLAFDFRDPITGNRDARRALAHAIDRASLAELGSPAVTVATGGIVPPALQGHTPEIALRHDPERAREAWRRAGVDGTVRLGAIKGDTVPFLERIADSWRSTLGANVELNIVPRTELGGLTDLIQLGNVVVHGWTPGYPDPEYFLRLLLQSDSHDITSVPGAAYRSERFDALVERARQERDGPTRLELFHTADRHAVIEDVALIPLLYLRNAYLVKPWVDGWWEFGKSWTSFADLVIAERR